ncbi:MAG: protein-glutamate O-methyltransferase CheR [Desulfosarcinaceae bacterium]
MSISLPDRMPSGRNALVNKFQTGANPNLAAGLRKAIKITPPEIDLFSKYIYAISGIYIDASKAYLLETRLGKILETEMCQTYGELYYKSKNDISKNIEKKIVDAITTNETLFFRDGNPFDLLKFKIFPEVFDKRAGAGNTGLSSPIRIWSAACSTGQEIYSIAMVLKELLGDVSKFNFYLLGTDISDEAIKQASYGTYNKFEIERGLPRERLQRFFTASGSNWKIRDEIRSMAVFKKLNLMGPLSSMGKFSIIFCRNVAIYFTLEDRKKLFSKLADSLEPDGYLVIGSTESLTGVCPRFIPKRHLKSIFYQLK